MVGPGDVQEQAIGPVDRHGRREADQPVTERLQRGAVGGRIVVEGDQGRDQGQGVGGLLVGMKAQGAGGLVDGG
ncbi:hypothetical protein E1H18_3485 [Caulobacter sp. RHG1]|nr:hypothetical protein [Caulobacter sp. RHG1]